jgi:protein ImuB
MERSEPGKEAENAQSSTFNPPPPQTGSAVASAKPSKVDKAVEEILTILHKWGIHTLGELAALDKEELRGRLGAVAVRLWERATGQANRLLKFVQPPESFEESFEFEHEIETAQPLLFILHRFLEQLALRLSALYLAARELTLQITFSSPLRDRSGDTSEKIYQHTFKIPQPTNDTDLLFRMLQTHLENFRSEYPIVGVALIAQPIKPVSQQFGLFETTLRNPHQLYETLARLTALLGSERIGTPVLEATHRPDAFRMEPFAWDLNPDDFSHPRPDAPRLALRRFRPSATASIFRSKHHHLQGEKASGKISDRCGPYFLSGNWWDEKSWARAEWDMQLENGDLCRAYESEGVWKIDGIYD